MLTILLIVLLVVALGGGWYGYGRWYGGPPCPPCPPTKR